MNGPRFEDLFEVMARASTGDTSARVEVGPDPDLDDPATRLSIALNVLLEDLGYRSEQAQTYLRELLDERTRSLRASQEEVRLRDEFISIAGHELNTPLMSLLLTVEGLHRGLIGRTPEEQQRSLALAERQTRKLSTLVERLLDVGRAQAGRADQLSRSREDLVGIVRDTVELAAPEQRRTGTEIRIRADNPVIGYWDRRRLEQVVTNVLANSLKFGAGKPVDITVERVGTVARVVIEDRGIGIDPERLPFVFERFERGVSSANYGGLGLGLFIVREIVVAHGGRVAAESEHGHGTTITIELPCDPLDVPADADRGGDSRP